jgi:glycyl-tRNA synthetase
VKNQEFDDAAKVIAKALTTAGISHIIDTTGTHHTTSNTLSPIYFCVMNYHDG